MSSRSVDLLIGDIIESGHKIFTYTANQSFEQFINDDKTVDTVIRNFEIIGEAANRLPDEFKDANTHIDWFRIRGFRNRIVHAYFGIDYSIVWLIKETFLPDIIKNLESLSKRVAFQSLGYRISPFQVFSRNFYR